MKVLKSKFEIIADYYIAHRDEIVGFVNKRLQYAEVAEDIVQDVFLRLLNTDKMLSTVTLPCLVYTVTRNLIYDYWRRHHSVEEYEHHLRFFSVCDDLDVASLYSAVEVHELLERGVARLTPNQRMVYRMNFYEGKPVSVISKTLGINYKSVEYHLGTARREIRQYIERMYV